MTDRLQRRLHALFEFDAGAGQLIWRTRPVEDFATVRVWKIWNTRFAGTVAGYVDVNGKGYRRIELDGKRWLAHRLIWVYAHGAIPDGFNLDHISGVRDDNRLVNLRLVTIADNNRNRSMSPNNTSGTMGVHWHKPSSKWQAKISVDRQLKHLGSFDNLSDAAAARVKAERDFGFHKGHGKPAAIRSLNDEAPK